MELQDRIKLCCGVILRASHQKQSILNNNCCKISVLKHFHSSESHRKRCFVAIMNRMSLCTNAKVLYLVKCQSRCLGNSHCALKCKMSNENSEIILLLGLKILKFDLLYIVHFDLQERTVPRLDQRLKSIKTLLK